MDAFKGVIIDAAAAAEIKKANPVYVYQTKKDAKQRNPVIGVDYGYFAEYAGSEEKDKSLQFTRDRSAIERMRNMNVEIEKKYYSDPSLVDITETRFSLLADKNEHFIPDDFELVNQPMPHPRSDLVDLLKHNDDLVYTALGIPKSMITEDTSTRGANIYAVNETFKMRIIWWKTIIGEIMTACYNLIYGENDGKEILDQYFEATGKTPTEITESEIYALRKENSPTVYLPMPPFISTKEIIEFYNMGALLPEELCNNLRKKAGLMPVTVVPYVPPRPGEQITMQLKAKMASTSKENVSETEDNTEEKDRKKLKKTE
jgi:hypothetical protein